MVSSMDPCCDHIETSNSRIDANDSVQLTWMSSFCAKVTKYEQVKMEKPLSSRISVGWTKSRPWIMDISISIPTYDDASQLHQKEWNTIVEISRYSSTQYMVE